ncbi:hypothetical protein BHM03_00031787 [Ensete ventricosum]|nr:hypothetical protein BHM03_00031787 [Ensete ventricosum]
MYVCMCVCISALFNILTAATLHLILMQGVVYWQPPEQALEKIKELVWDPSTSRYGADEGLPELRQALIEKVFPYKCRDTLARTILSWLSLRRENNLKESSVMVTAGANQVIRL